MQHSLSLTSNSVSAYSGPSLKWTSLEQDKVFGLTVFSGFHGNLSSLETVFSLQRFSLFTKIDLKESRCTSLCNCPQILQWHIRTRTVHCTVCLRCQVFLQKCFNLLKSLNTIMLDNVNFLYFTHDYDEDAVISKMTFTVITSQITPPPVFVALQMKRLNIIFLNLDCYVFRD